LKLSIIQTTEYSACTGGADYRFTHSIREGAFFNLSFFTKGTPGAKLCVFAVNELFRITYRRAMFFLTLSAVQTIFENGMDFRQKNNNSFIIEGSYYE